MINEIELIEKKNLRDEYIDKIEVLDKVKTLLLLPDIQLATTQQVADFYEVSERWIKMLLETNRDELVLDGYRVWKSKDFISEEKFPNKKVTINRGSFNVKFSDGTVEKFAPRGVALFPRRAILRIGMLLRDSKIAKEVRTQLLNIEEKATVEHKISAITEEQQLMLDVMYAKDDSDRLLAFSNFNAYKNRYINSLEQKVEALADGILRWNAREGVNKMARLIACKKYDGKFAKAYDRIGDQMLYKYNISINGRKAKSKLKKPTLFDVIQPSEMPMLVQACLALCQMYKINTDELLLKK